MLLYLPIAEMALSPGLLFLMGLMVGFVAGMFGVGGGFLLTPLLIFSGIPSAVAVASQASQIVASSFSGMLSYAKRDLIDFHLSTFMLIGGMFGVGCGVFIFGALSKSGQLDVVISISYMFILGAIGSLMFSESMRNIFKIRRKEKTNTGAWALWAEKLPFQMDFERSKVHASAVVLLFMGFCIGVLGTILGIGGGFILVPALIYTLRIPTTLAIGTSLFQTTLTMSTASLLHAVTNKEVDIVLAFILMVGGVIGAQFGAQMGQKLKAVQLRALLAIIILAVALRFGISLVFPPEESFTILTQPL